MKKNNPVYGECLICGDKFPTKKSHLGRRKTCSKDCDNIRRKAMYAGENNPNFGNRGPDNPLFKTGERFTRYGYKMIYNPDHPNAQKDGYIFEHRYVMSQHLGRSLTNGEHIHHKDENKLNNDIDNLEIVSLSEHTSLHNEEKLIIRDELGKIAFVLRKGRNPLRVNIRVKKTAPDVNLPKYQTELSAGFDIEAYIGAGESITVPVGERVLIGTGLCVQLPPKFELQLRPRSGLALKHGITLTNSPATIDADYTGEVKVILENRGSQPFVVENGMRICQGVVKQFEQALFTVVDELAPTDRGNSGFGSSGTK